MRSQYDLEIEPFWPQPIATCAHPRQTSIPHSREPRASIVAVTPFSCRPILLYAIHDSTPIPVITPELRMLSQPSSPRAGTPAARRRPWCRPPPPPPPATPAALSRPHCWPPPPLLAAAPAAGRRPCCWPPPPLLAAAHAAGRRPRCWPPPPLLAAAPAAGRRPHCRRPTRLPPAAPTTGHPLQPLAATPTAARSPYRPLPPLRLALTSAASRLPHSPPPPPLPGPTPAAARRSCGRPSSPSPDVASAAAHRPRCCSPPLLPLAIEPAAGHYWLPLPLSATTPAVRCGPLPCRAYSCVAFLFCFACLLMDLGALLTDFRGLAAGRGPGKVGQRTFVSVMLRGKNEHEAVVCALSHLYHAS